MLTLSIIAEHCYAECHKSLMLSVVMLNVVMLCSCASALLTSTELGWTCLPVTNAVAYSVFLSATKK